jgi:hypothetical protein
MGINFLYGRVPDATTLLKFRRLPEEHYGGSSKMRIRETLDRIGRMRY